MAKNNYYEDVPATRKKIMSSIHSKNTSIEVVLRRALWKKGIRYRKNYKVLPGSPDIAITKYKIAVFCDGELWHGKDWDSLQERLQKGKRGNYWVQKIQRNMERDRENDQALRAQEWTVLHFWGDDIIKRTDECVAVIEETIMDRIESECVVYFDDPPF